MTTDEAVSRVLAEAGIPLFSPIPLSACRITRPYLLERAGIGSGTVYVCALPYLSREPAGNISAYAAVRDYHLVWREIFDAVTAELGRIFPENKFVGFADHSPIDERDAAVRAGLGVLGDNGTVITEKYSSYVFLGELITDAAVECRASEIRRCEGCGECKRVCPKDGLGECLSSVTQKKGELTEREADALARHGTVWGCDLCQSVCPHTKRAVERGSIYTDIPRFLTDVIPTLDRELLSAMSDAAFAERAYSWRGRDTVLRNISILERLGSKNGN